LLQTSTFNSDYINILENVQEFSLKGPKEILESIKLLDPLLPQMPVAICSHKVLPNICRVLQISLNDFQNRDARENCRQAIVVCVDLMAKLGELKKIDEHAFEKECTNVITQLWTMTDRTIRTSMLNALKHLADLISKDAINRSIFDNIIAGFSDSNAKLRESTLMSLIYVVDKLDEVHLQDRLVRCVANLQNDPEASIRTNTTIFIGKIASKLKETVRQKMLCNALIKAMKDNFVHCRIAGLKTSIACLKFIDPVQLATKMMPQTSILLLDRSTDVRNLALSVIDASVLRMKYHHEHMIEEAKLQKEVEQDKKPVVGGSQDPNSWSSWSGSVLQGLSKTAGDGTDSTPSTPVPQRQPMATTADAKMTNKLTDHSVSNKSTDKINFLNDFNDDDDFNELNATKVINERKNVWDEDGLDGLDDDVSNNNVNSFSASGSTGNGFGNRNSMSITKNRWEDDDLDDIIDDLKDQNLSQHSKISTQVSPSPHSVSSSLSKPKAKPVKVAVKKLEANKDDWEDF
jgi:SCY1-like protein 1